MKILKFASSGSLMMLLAAAIAFGQSASPNPAKRIKAVEAFLDRLENVGYSGAVLVAVDGKPVISRGLGLSDAERKLKNKPTTVFDTGSITKQFTAAAILKLEMDGRLSTDDKITKYFREVPSDKADITIHQLLRHSSGLRSGVGGDYEKIGETEFLQKVFSSPLRSPAGTKFSYSNIGYSLLALIVEKVCGQNYEQYLYRNLWKPAGMEMTGYSRPQFDKDAIAVGYRNGERWGKPIEKEWAGSAPYLHLMGNGGILSTTEDLLKWDRALAGEAILSNEAKRKYYFPALRADETGPSHYGYGWDVRRTPRGTTRIWHNGSNGVFYADFSRFIDERVTIILMTNVWQNSFTSVGRSISRILFEDAHVPIVPPPENAANRAFTQALIDATVASGHEAAAPKLRSRKKGIELIESVVNEKGYDLLNEKKFKEAIELFKLNVLAFPGSANAFDSLAEAYLESGDDRSAIENYRKSLALDPDNDHARGVIKRISGAN